MVAARRIQKDLSQANFRPQKSDTTVKITVSIGVTEYSPQETMADFIKRADQAMYLSKQNGRNRISKLRATPAPN
jgi:diguanylate cyclase (GGDEF)-like protein